ncbi:energy transducer TonB [uncultured Hyphomicrobium sp.]|jgi:protein TonB|uniref:energy transducer TonB n=1 Tax=uncultured Hyphomicrobium sp. TaxID=194373 RepID=UPI0025EFD0AC|nr:energy transducer TonB [uncultured Hyphomicrobium sp.]
MSLRALTWMISFLLHGAVVGFFLVSTGGAALEEGTGEDTFIVEQGIYSERIEAVEAPPPVPLAAKPVEEVKPVEEDVPHVIGSEAGPEQDKIVLEEKPEDIPEVKEEPKVAVAQPTEIAVDEQKETGEKKSGGSVTAMSAYRGRLFAHISKKKVNPRSKIAGTVVVRFKVGPQGELLSREVATSSGSKLLDDAAVQSIERAAPFPKMPEDATDESMVVSVPFKFSVR